MRTLGKNRRLRHHLSVSEAFRFKRGRLAGVKGALVRAAGSLPSRTPYPLGDGARPARFRPRPLTGAGGRSCSLRVGPTGFKMVLRPKFYVPSSNPTAGFSI